MTEAAEGSGTPSIGDVIETEPAAQVTAVEPLGPIREGERLITLDVLRGVAMLGILFVNIQLFSLPFAVGFGMVGMDEAPLADELSWAFVKIFFEYKFISLFSLLFGAGMVVQMTRAEAKGRPFVGLYLRRLAVLAAFGMAHALLLWYGDILFVYALIGVFLLLVRKVPGRTMIIVAAAFVLTSAVLSFGCGSLQALMMQAQAAGQSQVEADAPAAGEADLVTDEDEPQADETEDIVPPEESEAEAVPEDDRMPRSLRTMIDAQFQPMNPKWIAGELEAYKHGPFLDAIIFRAASWSFALMGAVFSYGWRVAGMFLLGAGLMKLGFFLPTRRRWHAILCVAGFAVGVPMEVAAAGIIVANEHALNFAAVFAAVIHELGSFALCLGYTGAVSLLASSRRLGGLCRPFAQVGRVALTVYLAETIAATAVMYWWGLGWFGDLSRPQLLVMVFAIYVPLLVLSVLWLRFFTIGPFEWLWRTLTYGRLQPMVRRGGGSSSLSTT
jgi:uncharacterized protein